MGGLSWRTRVKGKESNKIPVWKNIITKLRNSMNWSDRRLDITNERIRELKDRLA